MADARKLADVLSELHARRGYARVNESQSLTEAWNEAVGGRLALKTRVGLVRRGVLEVTAADSASAQELQFQKEPILTKLTAALPEQKLRDLRCRIGPIK
jgi:predicted nucleic acid-binding Zn ribbon protein